MGPDQGKRSSRKSAPSLRSCQWFIWGCSKLGLANQLKTFPSNEIRKGELTMKMKKLKKEQDNLAWHKEATDLPVVSWEQCEYFLRC
jgi:hypothetical protein